LPGTAEVAGVGQCAWSTGARDVGAGDVDGDFILRFVHVHGELAGQELLQRGIDVGRR
jgi:hypothetical protein